MVTRQHGGTNLFLDGNLQFASWDEHRYHEALVHPAMAAAPRRARVMILGGGDGLGGARGATPRCARSLGRPRPGDDRSLRGARPGCAR
ncbi:MAG: hypothetical protein R3A48_19680 [Polyangiales bacterium]